MISKVLQRVAEIEEEGLGEEEEYLPEELYHSFVSMEVDDVKKTARLAVQQKTPGLAPTGPVKKTTIFW
jgi:hypothetical protein